MKRFLCITLREIPASLDALLLIAVLGTLVSCNEQSINTASQPAIPIELIDYKGETAIVPTGFPKALFNQSPEEFENYYRSLSRNNRSNDSEGISILSYEELQHILQKCVDRYPKIMFDDTISENDLKRIFQDFPKLKTVEDVNSKRPVIFDYYQDLCKRDVTLEVVRYGHAHGGNNDTGWNNLYNNMYGPYEHLVHIE